MRSSGTILTHAARVPRRAVLLVGVSVALGLGALVACGADGRAQAAGRPTVDLAQLQGKTILITGSTDGLGRELALRLGASGATIIVHGRNRERGMAVVQEIENGGKGHAKFIAADFASLAQVRALADSVIKDYPRLDILINNAGIWEPNAYQRTLTQDGYEQTFQINYLSHFLLTELLKPLLVKSAPSKIVNVSSISQSPIDLSDLMQERGFSGGRGYGTSKLAQVMNTIDLAAELQDSGVTVNAVHPASQMNTNLVIGNGRVPQSSVQEGGQSVLYVVVTPNLGTGKFFAYMREASPMAQAFDPRARESLRTQSLALVGLK